MSAGLQRGRRASVPARTSSRCSGAATFDVGRAPFSDASRSARARCRSVATARRLRRVGDLRRSASRPLPARATRREPRSASPASRWRRGTARRAPSSAAFAALAAASADANAVAQPRSAASAASASAVAASSAAPVAPTPPAPTRQPVEEKRSPERVTATMPGWASARSSAAVQSPSTATAVASSTSSSRSTSSWPERTWARTGSAPIAACGEIEAARNRDGRKRENGAADRNASEASTTSPARRGRRPRRRRLRR